MHHFINLVIAFIHKYGIEITVCIILYRMGIFHLVYRVVYNIAAYIYLFYAYVVVFTRKLKKAYKFMMNRKAMINYGK